MVWGLGRSSSDLKKDRKKITINILLLLLALKYTHAVHPQWVRKFKKIQAKKLKKSNK